jgi:hypothetical protein
VAVNLPQFTHGIKRDSAATGAVSRRKLVLGPTGISIEPSATLCTAKEANPNKEPNQVKQAAVAIYWIKVRYHFFFFFFFFFFYHVQHLLL